MPKSIALNYLRPPSATTISKAIRQTHIHIKTSLDHSCRYCDHLSDRSLAAQDIYATGLEAPFYAPHPMHFQWAIGASIGHPFGLSIYRQKSRSKPLSVLFRDPFVHLYTKRHKRIHISLKSLDKLMRFPY